MPQLAEMIAAHPHVRWNANPHLARAAEIAALCASVCRACADACLGEEREADLVQCIRLDLDCADICQAFSIVALRRSGGDVPVIDAASQTCEAACRRCEAECRRHAEMHEHCRICADLCLECADACREARHSLGDAHSPAPGGAR